MNDDTTQKIQAIEEKIDAIYVSVEKTRKYFKVTMWVTIILFVLPLIAVMFVAPMALNTYTSTLGGGSLGI